jgi:hypothetical protein
MAKIIVAATGNHGYHPASGEHLHKGSIHVIEEEAYSAELFEILTEEEAEVRRQLAALAEGEAAAEAAAQTEPEAPVENTHDGEEN